MNRQNIDDRIREYLPDDVANSLQDFDDKPSLLELTIRATTSRFRTINLLGAAFIVVFVGLLLFSIWHFYLAVDIKALVGRSLAVMFCATSIGLMKIWYWILINRYDTTCEIKRLELQVAILARSLHSRP
ncbi:MAG: DUF6768 family protein [Pirellulaceae bacterium]|nr:hypothetical protein [Planctomycetales bacterium]